MPEDARRARSPCCATPHPRRQAEIDYGRLEMWADPAAGRRRTVWAFVMVLAGARHMLVRPTLLLDQHEWPPRTGGVRVLRWQGDWRGGICRRQVLTLLPGASSAAFVLTVVSAPFPVPPVKLFMWFSRMWT